MADRSASSISLGNCGLKLCMTPGHWRFTASSARRLFARHFGEANTSVNTYGNVLTAVAFLEGLAVQDLEPEELDHCDRDYPVTIAVAAFKPEERD